MVVSAGGAGVTVSCTGAEVTPWALAVRVTLPPLCAIPVALAVFTPSLLRPFTAAMLVLELTHVNVSPGIVSLN